MNKTKTDLAFISLLRTKGISLSESLEVAEKRLKLQNDDLYICGMTDSGTHYHRYGKANSSKKVIMLHAMGGNLHNWIPVSVHLYKDCDIFVIDLPWHGLTTFTQDLDENYTDFYYRWLNDFVNQLSLQDINIVGHSLGARIATVYAANSGETVKSIVAITPAYSPSLKGLVFIESAILKMLATRYGKMLDREVLKLFLHEMLLSKQRDTLTFLDFAIEEVIRDQSPLNMKGVLEALKWFQSERFAFENIRVLSDRIPVTILCGQKDIYCSNRELLDIVGSKLKLEIIKRSGHLLPLEHPKICSNRILSTVYSN